MLIGKHKSKEKKEFSSVLSTYLFTKDKVLKKRKEDFYIRGASDCVCKRE